MSPSPPIVSIVTRPLRLWVLCAFDVLVLGVLSLLGVIGHMVRVQSLSVPPTGSSPPADLTAIIVRASTTSTYLLGGISLLFAVSITISALLVGTGRRNACLPLLSILILSRLVVMFASGASHFLVDVLLIAVHWWVLYASADVDAFFDQQEHVQRQHKVTTTRQA